MATPEQTSDGLTRTDWFLPSVEPTVPGSYECTTGSGHVFRRTWAGATWISPVNGAPTTVRMMWRGVVPGSISIGTYPSALRNDLRDSIAHVTELVEAGHAQYDKEGRVAPSETHALAMGALYS